MKYFSLCKLLKKNNIQIPEDTLFVFKGSSWNDCVATGRSAGGSLAMAQGGAADYSGHLLFPMGISSDEAEYISAAAACVKANYLRIFLYMIWNVR